MREQEIAGYREVLALIHDSYDYIVPRTNIILQLHRDLYQFNPSAIGGRLKMQTMLSPRQIHKASARFDLYRCRPLKHRKQLIA